jgi:hypothetical protein
MFAHNGGQESSIIFLCVYTDPSTLVQTRVWHLFQKKVEDEYACVFGG